MKHTTPPELKALGKVAKLLPLLGVAELNYITRLIVEKLRPEAEQRERAAAPGAAPSGEGE